MNTETQNYHVSSMPQLRTADTKGVVMPEAEPLQQGDRVKVTMPGMAPRSGTFLMMVGHDAAVKIDGDNIHMMFGPSCLIEHDTRPAPDLVGDQFAELKQRYARVTNVDPKAIVRVENDAPRHYVVRFDPARTGNFKTLGVVEGLQPNGLSTVLILADTFHIEALEGQEWRLNDNTYKG